ncbi:hypothetical protein BDB01DRAFT_851242 [Pilobolus umbonatus]|nr:hypothetical protein BDB01DRAFT_851242 [Pilobolus umbonatus]
MSRVIRAQRKRTQITHCQCVAAGPGFIVVVIINILSKASTMACDPHAGLKMGLIAARRTGLLRGTKNIKSA